MGLVAAFDPPVVAGEAGRTAWELSSYAFLDDDPPDTAHPALWRQAQLNRIAGLFELAPGLYQLRGFDLSNMHVIEGEEGIVVVDPLVTAETAAAALDLYREHRGQRPVTGLIYTHSHVDHFGGARGVVVAGGRRVGPGPGPRAGRFPRARGQRERLRRHRRWRAAPATCTGRCSIAAPTGS